MQNNLVLLIYDSKIIKELQISGNQILIFPLHTDWEFLSMLRNKLEKKFSKVGVVNSADLISKTIEKIRPSFLEWVGNLGDMVVHGKRLKELLLLPDERTSIWWFSLMGDKDPMKHGGFLKLAQMLALKDFINLKPFDEVIIAIDDLLLRKFLQELLINKKINYRFLKVKKEIKLKNALKKLPFLIKQFFLFERIIVRMALSKFVMKGLSRETNNHFLFITYFPSITRDGIITNTFKNKFCMPLQQAVNQKGFKISWILIYAPFDNYSFWDATLLTRKLVRKGESLFFWEEFLKLIDFWNTFKYGFHLIKIRNNITKCLQNNMENSFLRDKLLNKFSIDFIHKAIFSLCTLHTLLYYFSFKRLFFYFNHAKKCIYFSEMLFWERALEAAKNSLSIDIRTLAFQHSSLPINMLNYFFSSSELKKANKKAELPFPNMLAANGYHPAKIFERQGIDDIQILESVRYFYIRKYYMRKEIKKDNIILIATSIEFEESYRIFITCVHAFKNFAKKALIWLKTHPTMPLEKKVKVPKSWEIKKKPISELLERVRIVVCGSTTVAIEALSTGCDVVTPVFADVVNMCPLLGFEKFYHPVYSPNELRKTVEEMMNKPLNENWQEKKKFVENYWNLDKSLRNWKSALNLI